jgi:hypothetical protein
VDLVVPVTAEIVIEGLPEPGAGRLDHVGKRAGEHRLTQQVVVD